MPYKRKYNVLNKIYTYVVLFQHSGHTFKQLNSIYEEHVQKISTELAQLKRRHIELISVSQDVVSYWELISVSQDVVCTDQPCY